MSHFIGLCFGEFWEDSLDYYDENLEVDRYVEYTKDEAIDAAKQDHAKMYEYALNKLSESNLSSENLIYYQNIIDKGLFLSYEDAWEVVKKWGYKIDDDENLTSTYNPNSKWDWYCIGGRWDGFLQLKEKDENGNSIKSNQACYKEIDWDYMFEKDIIPFCFIDHDGEWYEKGSMGWWGFVSDEKDNDEWINKFKNYISELDEDCLVTVVDFHI